MAIYHKHEALNKIQTIGMMPLFYHDDLEICQQVVDAVFNGGCDILEFTHRGDMAMEVFSGLVKYVRTHFPNALIGVGSIHDPYLGAYYIGKGADIVVGPSFNSDLAKLCNRHSVLYVPGCASVTEIHSALEMGVDLVKIFPASSIGGSDFFKAIKGPCPKVKLMPTGGVSCDAENLKQWFSAGATAVGMGSNLISKTILTNKSFDDLENNTKKILALIKKLQS